LSQSLQGAGGVGGLLAVIDGSLTYQYLYDANGNVGQLVDAADGTIAARYEYDPYGNLTDLGGAYADANAYRFSTKYFDEETNMYYYGYRYYSAELGRWINRDPMGEKGGSNLNVLLENNPLNSFDYLGLAHVVDRYKWSSPFIYFLESLTYLKADKNYGTYNIEFRVAWDSGSGKILNVSIEDEHYEKYRADTDDGMHITIFRTPVKYKDCSASFEQQITVSTRDVGDEIIAYIGKEYIKSKIDIPGGKITKYVRGKIIGKIIDAATQPLVDKYVEKIATFRTLFNFESVSGQVGYDVELDPVEVSRTGRTLRFQDDLSPLDQRWNDLDDDEFWRRLETMSVPKDEIERRLEER
jgi:RHS repeat-associated protein